MPGIFIVAGLLSVFVVATGFTYEGYGFELLFPIAIAAVVAFLKLRSRHNVGVVYRRSVENYRQERKRILASIHRD